MSLKDVRVRAPLWARKKDRRKRSFLVPKGPVHPPPLQRLPPRGLPGEDPRTPSRQRFPAAAGDFPFIDRRACVLAPRGRLPVTLPLTFRPSREKSELVQISEASRKERPQVLIPSPRGRDSAAEAAVRLQAQSLRSVAWRWSLIFLAQV